MATGCNIVLGDALNDLMPLQIDFRITFDFTAFSLCRQLILTHRRARVNSNSSHIFISILLTIRLSDSFQIS